MTENRLIAYLSLTAALLVGGAIVRGLLSDGFGIAIMACSMPFAIAALCGTVKGVVK